MRIVQAGNLVMLPIAGPRVLPAALYRRAQETGPIELRLAAPLTDPGWLRGENAELFKIEFELFIGDYARQVTDEGRGTYLPNLFSLTPKDEKEQRPERRTVDVFLTAVTPPDDEGYVQFGAHNWNKRMYVRSSRHTIAEVDPGLRPVCGDNKVHVSEIDAFVEIPPVEITMPLVEAWLRRVEDEAVKAEYLAIVEELKGDLDRLIVVGPAMSRLPPLQVRRTLGLAQPPEVAKIIAGYVSELVPDGATIQIGVGEPGMYLPRAGAFDKKHDLGLHTEMVAPGIAKLVDGGVITGKRKTLHAGKAVAVAWSGSDIEDLRIVTNNPKFEVRDPDYVLDPEHDLAEREHALAEQRAVDRPDRADQLGERVRLAADQRHRRAAGDAHRGRALARRPGDHDAPLNGDGRRGLAHRRAARAGGGDHGAALLRRHDRHRVRRRAAVGKEPPPARGGANRHRPPGLPRGAPPRDASHARRVVAARYTGAR